MSESSVSTADTSAHHERAGSNDSATTTASTVRSTRSARPSAILARFYQTWKTPFESSIIDQSSVVTASHVTARPSHHPPTTVEKSFGGAGVKERGDQVLRELAEGGKKLQQLRSVSASLNGLAGGSSESGSGSSTETGTGSRSDGEVEESYLNVAPKPVADTFPDPDSPAITGAFPSDKDEEATLTVAPEASEQAGVSSGGGATSFATSEAVEGPKQPKESKLSLKRTLTPTAPEFVPGSDKSAASAVSSINQRLNSPVPPASKGTKALSPTQFGALHPHTPPFIPRVQSSSSTSRPSGATPATATLSPVLLQALKPIRQSSKDQEEVWEDVDDNRTDESSSASSGFQSAPETENVDKGKSRFDEPKGDNDTAPKVRKDPRVAKATPPSPELSKMNGNPSIRKRAWSKEDLNESFRTISSPSSPPSLNSLPRPIPVVKPGLSNPGTIRVELVQSAPSDNHPPMGHISTPYAWNPGLVFNGGGYFGTPEEYAHAQQQIQAAAAYGMMGGSHSRSLLPLHQPYYPHQDQHFEAHGYDPNLPPLSPTQPSTSHSRQSSASTIPNSSAVTLRDSNKSIAKNGNGHVPRWLEMAKGELDSLETRVAKLEKENKVLRAEHQVKMSAKQAELDKHLFVMSVKDDERKALRAKLERTTEEGKSELAASLLQASAASQKREKELQGFLAQSREKIVTLEAEKALHLRTVKDLTASKLQLQVELHEAKAALKSTTTDDSLQISLHDALREKESIELSMRKLNQEKRDLVTKNEEAASTMLSLRKEKAELAVRVRTLEHEQGEFIEELTNTEDELKDERSHSEAKDAVIRQLQSTLRHSQAGRTETSSDPRSVEIRISKIKNELTIEYEGKFLQLKREAQEKVARLTDEINRLRVESGVKDNKGKGKEVDSSSDEVQHLTKGLDEAMMLIDDLTSECEQLRRENKQLDESLQEVIDSVEGAES